MKNRSENMKFFEDMAKIAGGAFQSMGEIREQIKSIVRSFLTDMDLVTREEFERVEGMAQKARENQLKMERRITALEKGTKKPAPRKKAPAKKTTTRKKK